MTTKSWKLSRSSKLSGAFLDVFLNEPLPKEHPFWKHAKIQITPHVASLTNVATSIEQITENYNRFLKKEKLLDNFTFKSNKDGNVYYINTIKGKIVQEAIVFEIINPSGRQIGSITVRTKNI